MCHVVSEVIYLWTIRGYGVNNVVNAGRVGREREGSGDIRNGEKRDRVLNGEDMGKVRRTCQSDVRKERLRYVEHEVLEMWMLCVPQRAENCGCVYKDSKLGLLLQ